MTNEEAINMMKMMMPLPRRGDGKSTTHLLQTLAISMAIDALQERKTGRWVLSQNQIDLGWDINCSVCGKGDNGFFANGRENAECKLKHQYLMDAKKREGMRYCNYCGAKMEVDE